MSKTMSTMSAQVIVILFLISILFLTTSESKGGGGRGGGSRGGGGMFGRGKSGSSSSSGGGGWFKSGGSKVSGGKSGGWGSKSSGKFNTWPRGSSSVYHGGRSTRIIPIPIFLPGMGMGMGGYGMGGYGMGGYGMGGYGHGYYGNHHYSRQMYKEEDGFYPCPPDIVATHKETLNKSIDEAIKSGQFDQLFLGFNSTNGTSGTNVSNGLPEGSITPDSVFQRFNNNTNGNSEANLPSQSRAELVNQIQSAIANFTFMCYDESRDSSNDDDDGDGYIALAIIVLVILTCCCCFFVRKSNQKGQQTVSNYDATTPINFNQRVPSGALLVTPRPSITPQVTPSAPPSDPMDHMMIISDPPPSYDETIKREWSI